MNRNGKSTKEYVSLASIADKLVKATKRIMQAAKTEEDLRIRFEKKLEPLIESGGIKFDERYERLSAKAKTILKGKRPDAVHGQVVIEYEAPESFRSKSRIDHAYAQLVEYMSAEIKAARKDRYEGFVKIVGVGFDGRAIFFVRCRSKVGTNSSKGRTLKFVMDGPYMFGPESAFTFVTYLRALARLPLSAESLAERFGPKSDVAREAVGAFADALENWSTPRVKVFLKEWGRLFGIVYGEQFASGTDKKTKALAEIYGLADDAEFQSMLFCVHTYFAILMKLIAAELLSISEGSFRTSFSSKLAHGSSEELLDDLTEIEDGGIYHKRGITNFLEGDFFRWYLEAFSSPRLQDAIRAVARTLSEFEPATTSIEPEVSRDLLKKLYQYLVPEVVRHHLGEYYTPDWLAELVLNEVGFRGDTRKRVLDPACGSGTFLVLAIQRARAFGEKNKEKRIETAKRILSNVWGFDFNPLAVIASRTNYLFALGDVAKELGEFEIPVYLADSVLWPKRTGQMMLASEGVVEIQTSVGSFLVPKIWVERQGYFMRQAAPLIEEIVRAGCKPTEAMERLRKNGLIFPPHEKVVLRFYEHIAELEQEGRNGIWARFLKNVFAPMMADKFDFVVGNPPWIRWGYLSSEYRKATLEMWKMYGLFSLKGHAARLGGGEKDFSMLFTYAAADHYLTFNGKLGFLITQEVFKSKGAGEGFRKFRLGDREKLKVLKAHDLVSVQPFEGAANKTAAILLRKSGETEYPVPYTIWKRKKGIGHVPTDLRLDEAIRLLEKKKLVAKPIGKSTDSWQTIEEGDLSLDRIKGNNHYQARRGASMEPYGVFWMELDEVLFNGDLIVQNLVEKGKWKIKKVRERIEPDLVYPAVSGADIKPWGAEPVYYVLVTQDPETRMGYSEKIMKRDWPRTFAYVGLFRKELLSRASYKKYHAETNNPFYSQYNIADYTFARHKVIWKRMASDLVASVINQTKTRFGWKSIIPTDTTSLIATEDENEAHYLCSVLNSMAVRKFLKSYSSAGRGFGAPSIMKHVGIPKFDENNAVHKRLSGLSKDLHRLRKEEKAEEIKLREEKVEDAVQDLFCLRKVR